MSLGFMRKKERELDIYSHKFFTHKLINHVNLKKSLKLHKNKAIQIYAIFNF